MGSRNSRPGLYEALYHHHALLHERRDSTLPKILALQKGLEREREDTGAFCFLWEQPRTPVVVHA